MNTILNLKNGASSIPVRFTDNGDGTYSMAVSGISGGGGGGTGDASASNQVIGNTSLANIDADLGLRSDAAWSGTGDGTVVAVLKAMWTRLAGLLKVSQQNHLVPKIFNGLTTSANLVMTTANADTKWQVQGGAGYLLTITQPPGSTAALSLASLVVLESSFDNANWAGVNITRLGVAGANVAVSGTLSTGLFSAQAPIGDTVYLRLRLTGNATTGSVMAFLEPDLPNAAIVLPQTFTVTSGNNLMPPIDVAGMTEIAIQVSAITGAAYTLQGTNDPTLNTTNWVNVSLIGANNSSFATANSAQFYVGRVKEYHWARLVCTTTGTAATISLKGNYGTSSNLQNISFIENGTIQIIGQRIRQASGTLTTVNSTVARVQGNMFLGDGNILLPINTLAPSGSAAVITGVQMIIANSTAAQLSGTKAQFDLWAFNTSNGGGITLIDNSTFNPTAAQLAGGIRLGGVGGLIGNMGNTAYGYTLNNLNWMVTAGSGGNIWLLLVLATPSYSSVAAEQVRVTLNIQY